MKNSNHRECKQDQLSHPFPDGQPSSILSLSPPLMCTETHNLCFPLPTTTHRGSCDSFLPHNFPQFPPFKIHCRKEILPCWCIRNDCIFFDHCVILHLQVLPHLLNTCLWVAFPLFALFFFHIHPCNKDTSMYILANIFVG